jgi:hypothetical protein
MKEACSVSKISVALMNKLVANGMVRQMQKGSDTLVNVADVGKVLAQAFGRKGQSK